MTVTRSTNTEFSLDNLPSILNSQSEPFLVHDNKEYLSVHDVYLSFERVREIIERIRFAPIISLNRKDAIICFTVVPYKAPDFFSKDQIEPIEDIHGNALWATVSAITSLYKQSTPVFWRGSLYLDNDAYWGAFADYASSVQVPHPIVLEAIYNYPAGSQALDIGAGKGAEAIELCKRGWKVTVVEKSKQVIDVFDRICLAIPEAWIMSVNQCCISEFVFPSSRYHLVVAYDVLPYVDFSKMESIFQKISKSLLRGGRFVGTFILGNSGDPDCDTRRLSGVFHLPRAGMVAAMIKDVGLIPETLQYRYHSDEPLHSVIEFSSGKL